MDVAYACFSNNDLIRDYSSSGGIFSEIAKAVLREDGIVYGVALSADCYSAGFERVTQLNELSKLVGSKYVQADLGKTYILVKNDLNAGKKVLFSGTVCQVNGLKLFLGKEYESLICVDVICHGVPSKYIWKKYITDIESRNKAKAVTVSFRRKNISALMDTSYKQQNVYYIHKNQNPYMLFFMNNYDLRPSCYNCQPKTRCMSDLTIGDFWGIEKVASSFCEDSGRGCSLMIVHTSKGDDLIRKIGDSISLQSVSYEDSLRENALAVESVNRPIQRDSFYVNAKKMSMANLVQKYIFWGLKGKIKMILLLFPIFRKYQNSKLKKYKGTNHDYGMEIIFDKKCGEKHKV